MLQQARPPSGSLGKWLGSWRLKPPFQETLFPHKGVQTRRSGEGEKQGGGERSEGWEGVCGGGERNGKVGARGKTGKGKSGKGNEMMTLLSPLPETGE